MAIITEDYVSFETAKLLKEKGFEQEPNYATSWYANQYYKNSCQGEWFEGEHQIIEDIDDKFNISYLSERGIFIPAPTLQMAMKWLREVHKLVITVSICNENNKGNTDYSNPDRWFYFFDITDAKGVVIDTEYDPLSNEFPTYEESCEAAIKYCLENLI